LEAEKETGPLLAKLNGRWPRYQVFNNAVAAKMARDSRRYFTPKHLFVVRNGIDLQHFRSAPLVPRERVHIVGVGTLLPVKRWDRLLRAASMLRQQGHDFLVEIVGDGPLRAFLLKEVNRLGLTRCVEFPGYRENIPDLLAEATFVVHTSDSEGCPNVIMEAMACGRAVVATDVGDIPYLIENEKTGFVVPRDNEAILAKRMATLITDRELCCVMGRAGRIKAEQELSLDRLVAQTFAIYRKAGLRDA
jgi:glycosyltransferase involved in cell wall biosynthesis